MARKSRNDNEKRERTKIEVRNPRYKGATPEDVGRALLRSRGDRRNDDDEKDEGEEE